MLAEEVWGKQIAFLSSQASSAEGFCSKVRSRLSLQPAEAAFWQDVVFFFCLKWRVEQNLTSTFALLENENVEPSEKKKNHNKQQQENMQKPSLSLPTQYEKQQQTDTWFAYKVASIHSFFRAATILKNIVIPLPP